MSILTHGVRRMLLVLAVWSVAGAFLGSSHAAITVLDSATAYNNTYQTTSISMSFSGLDLTGGEKLVVTIGVQSTGPGTSAGERIWNSVKFDNRSMTEAARIGCNADSQYQSGIYYLDDLTGLSAAGSLVISAATLNARGASATAWVLGSVGSGHGASGASLGSSASLTTTSADSWVLAHATVAGTTAPTAQPPLVAGLTVVNPYTGSSQTGNGTGTQTITSPGSMTPTFDSGATTVAAEFLPPPPGAITLSASTYSVNESAGVVTVSVSRVESAGGSVGVTLTATNLVVVDAIAGTDFTAVVTNLTWADGDSSDRLVEIPITDDSDSESAEQFCVFLSDFSGAEVGSITSATVTIVDDDAVNVAPVAVDDVASTDEDVAVSIPVASNDTDANSDPLTVSSVDDPANGTAVVQAGTHILYTPDADWNGVEVFDYVITDGALSDTGTVTVTVNSVQDPGVLALSTSSVSVAETAGSVTISVSRTGGAEGAVTARVMTINGTAIGGSDFTAVDTILNWPDGDGADQDVTITLFDDPVTEGLETFSLVLTNATGGASLTHPTNAVVSLIDDELMTDTYADTSYTYNTTKTVDFSGFDPSGSDKLVAVIVSRNGGIQSFSSVTFNGQAMTNIQTQVNDRGATSLFYLDSPPAGGNLYMAASEQIQVTAITLFALSGTAAGFTGPVFFDTTLSGSITTSQDGTLVIAGAWAGENATTYPTLTPESPLAQALALSIPTGVPASAAAIGYYIDPDAGVVNLSFTSTGTDTRKIIVAAGFPPAPAGEITLEASTYAVSESSGAVTVKVSRVNGSYGEVAATFTATNLVPVDAVAGVDYTAIATNLTWGYYDASDRLVEIPINDDSEEESAERFRVFLSDFSGAEVGSITSATVTIVDDDAVNVAPVAVDDVASTDEDVAVVIAVASNDTDGNSDPLTVSSVDDPANGTAVVQAGTHILYTPDADWNGVEVFDYVITDGALSDTGTVTVTVNSVQDPGVLALSTSSVSVSETAGSVTISVSRSSGAEGAVSVQVMTVAGSAIAGNDFASVSTTLNWSDGDAASKDVTITLLDDSLTEGLETFTIVLANASGGAVISDPATAVVTIIDDELKTATYVDSAFVYSNVRTVDFSGFDPSGSDKLVAAIMVRGTDTDFVFNQVTFNGQEMMHLGTQGDGFRGVATMFLLGSPPVGGELRIEAASGQLQSIGVVLIALSGSPTIFNGLVLLDAALSGTMTTPTDDSIVVAACYAGDAAQTVTPQSPLQTVLSTELFGFGGAGAGFYVAPDAGDVDVSFASSGSAEYKALVAVVFSAPPGSLFLFR